MRVGRGLKHVALVGLVGVLDVARLMPVGRGLKRDVLGHVAGRAVVARLIRVERRLKQLRRRAVSAYRTLALEPWPRPHIDAHATPQPDGAATKHGGRSPHHFAKRGIERDHPQRQDCPQARKRKSSGMKSLVGQVGIRGIVSAMWPELYASQTHDSRAVIYAHLYCGLPYGYSPGVRGDRRKSDGKPATAAREGQSDGGQPATRLGHLP